MATSIMGYPQETSHCPSCGSSDIITRDEWNQDGLMKCNICDCKCYIIQAEEDQE